MVGVARLLRDRSRIVRASTFDVGDVLGQLGENLVKMIHAFVEGNQVGFDAGLLSRRWAVEAKG